MTRQLAIAALLVAVVVGACGGTATPVPSSVAVTDPSPSAASSVLPGATSSPSVEPPASTAPTVAPTATPTVAPTPAPTPVPWKTYTSKLFHYKMSYPPDWIVTPGTATRSDEYDNYGYPYIYVTRDTVSTSVSISRTVSFEIAYFKSHYKTKLVSNQGIKLANGYTGRLLTFNGTDDGVKVVIKELIVGKGKIGYFLTMFGQTENGVADRTLFRKMFESWRPTR